MSALAPQNFANKTKATLLQFAEPKKNMNKIQYLDYQSGGRHDRGQTGTAVKQRQENEK